MSNSDPWTSSWVSGLNYTGVVEGDDIRALGDKLINPMPQDATQFQPASLDLTLGAIVTQDRTVSYLDSSRGSLRLQSGEVALILTREEINMPLDFAGTAFPIGRLALDGLIALNLGHIDPGYRGPIVIPIMNFQRNPYPFSIKDKVVTVVFERLAHVAVGYPEPYIDFDKRVREARRSALTLAPAALLDTQSKVFQQLIEAGVRSVLIRIAGRTLVALTAIIAFAASLIAVLEFVVPLIKR